MPSTRQPSRRGALTVAALAPLMASAPATAQAKVRLRLAAAQWPPYSIGNRLAEPGLAHEFLSGILAGLGYQLEVDYLPWSRALLEAREGRRIDGLLTAVPSEANGLVVTSSPSFSYEVVFYVQAANPWRYRGAASLREVRLGVVADYGYGEPLDAHLAEPANAGRLQRLTGEDTTRRLLRLLEIGRIDAFAEDRSVVQWTAARQGASMTGIREAGALRRQPVYLALHPDLPNAKRLIAQLNQVLAQPASRAAFQALQKRYASGAAPAPQ